MAILLNTVQGLGPQDDIGKGNWVWVLCLGGYERFSDMWVEIPGCESGSQVMLKDNFQVVSLVHR